MPIKTTRRVVLGAGLALAAPSIVRGQGIWPGKAITIVVNFPAGGLTDGIARAFGQHVQQATGQQVIIDNKPGASGNIGAALHSRCGCRRLGCAYTRVSAPRNPRPLGGAARDC